MKKYTLSFILIAAYFLICVCHAQDKWICQEQSSILRGNSLYACGIGLGWNESLARADALEKAKFEFDRVCSLNAGCADKKVKAEPTRTSCIQISHNKYALNHYQCHRMIIFTVLQQ